MEKNIENIVEKYKRKWEDEGILEWEKLIKELKKLGGKNK